MKTIQKLKTKYGSVLVFTLIVMFVILVSAMGIASVSVIERRTSSDTGKSTQSFQVADSGAEIMLQKIYKGSGTYIQDLASVPANCAGGVVSGDIGSVEKSFKVTFYKEDGTQLTNCGTDKVADVRKIKSVGTYANTSRAVEVAVAQSACGSGAVTKVVASSNDEDFTDANMYDIFDFTRDATNSGAIFEIRCRGIIGIQYRVLDFVVGYVAQIANVGTCDIGASPPEHCLPLSYIITFHSATGGSIVQCSKSDGCVESSMACNRGWEVIGFCN